MQVQSENGSVIISNIAAKHVSTNAQNPGPSGSAVIERENYFILIISISKNYNVYHSVFLLTVCCFYTVVLVILKVIIFKYGIKVQNFWMSYKTCNI